MLVKCNLFRPFYQAICFACTRIKIAVFIQRNHRFERSFQFRLVYITCGHYVMPQTYGVNIFLVHQIRISTINVSSVMLGIETVYERPYKKYPHF